MADAHESSTMADAPAPAPDFVMDDAGDSKSNHVVDDTNYIALVRKLNVDIQRLRADYARDINVAHEYIEDIRGEMYQDRVNVGGRIRNMHAEFEKQTEIQLALNRDVRDTICRAKTWLSVPAAAPNQEPRETPTSLVDAQNRELQRTVMLAAAQIQELQDTLKGTADQNQALREAFERTQPVLPTPPRFEGDRFRFKAWLSTIKAKMEVDGHTMRHDFARFHYVWSCIDPKIQMQYYGTLRAAKESGLWDYMEILRHLEIVFGDHNQVREAQMALEQSKQRRARHRQARQRQGEMAVDPARQQEGEVLQAYIDGFQWLHGGQRQDTTGGEPKQEDGGEPKQEYGVEPKQE